MTKPIQTITELLEDLHDSVSCYVDDKVEEVGVMNTCPHCCANELLADYKTSLLADLYRLGKGDPELLMAHLTAHYLYSQAFAHLMGEVLREAVEVHKPELQELEDRDDG